MRNRVNGVYNYLVNRYVNLSDFQKEYLKKAATYIVLRGLFTGFDYSNPAGIIPSEIIISSLGFLSGVKIVEKNNPLSSSDKSDQNWTGAIICVQNALGSIGFNAFATHTFGSVVGNIASLFVESCFAASSVEHGADYIKNKRENHQLGTN